MSPEVQKIFIDILVALSPIIIGLLGMIQIKIHNYIQAHTDNKLAETGLLKMNDAVFAVVKEMNQLVVSEFKKANADGKLTPEEKSTIKQMAINKLKDYISIKELMRIFGFGSEPIAEAFIGTKIESTIASIKNETAIFGNP
jgi:hypothetical protein